MNPSNNVTFRDAALGAVGRFETGRLRESIGTRCLARTNLPYTVRLIVLYCFQVSGSKQEEELSLVQFRSADVRVELRYEFRVRKRPPSVARLRLASRKSFTVGDDDGYALHQRHVGVSGKMANRDVERGFMSPWISPPFRRKHLRDVRKPHAVSVAVDEKHGRRGGLKLVAPKSYPFEAMAAIRWTRFGKSSGVGLSFLYSASWASL